MRDFTLLVSRCFLSLAWVIVFSLSLVYLCLYSFISVAFRWFALFLGCVPLPLFTSVDLLEISILFMFVAPSGVGSPVCTSWESDELTSGWHQSGPYSLWYCI